MPGETNARLHDAYAADYDAQVQAYDCHIADVLFGLCYEYAQPGQRLLDVGIGTGLSAQLFAKAGLRVSGMDFAPVMLELCAAKKLAADLTLHDLAETPWPYAAAAFDHVVCCGVLHFLGNIEGIFDAARRVLAEGGTWAFTTKQPAGPGPFPEGFDRQPAGGFDIFAHPQAHVEALLSAHGFVALKRQRCYVGDDVFMLWVTRAV